MKQIQWLTLLKDGPQGDPLTRSLMAENIRRGRILAYVSILFETMLALLDISASILKVDNRFHFSSYFIMYALMITMNIAYLLVINRFPTMDSISVSRMRRVKSTILSYITLMMIWGSVVTLMDQKLYGQLMVFMINMITCSVIYAINSRSMLIPYVISSVILLVGLPFFQGSRDVLIGHYVNLCFFIVVSWIASRMIYRYYCNDFNSKALLNNTNLLLEKKINDYNHLHIKLTEVNAQLKEMSLIDDLTGIPNRRSFRYFIDAAFDRKNIQENMMFSVIMIDIDHFKEFNDHYGHSDGDMVLKEVAQTINQLVTHSMDFFVRWGGEEFIYATFHAHDEEISSMAALIKDKVLALNINHDYSEVCRNVTVSIGCSTVPVRSKSDISRCIDLADQSLYHAKSSGRNCIREYREA